MIFVTNRNEFMHSDRYDGTEYLFPPHQAVPISEEAAAHMFGFGAPDKGPVLARLGWSFHYDESKKTFVNDEAGPVKLAKFVFTKGEFVPRDVDTSPIPEAGNLLDESPI